MTLLKTGVYLENYLNFNFGNGGNELGLQDFFNYPRAHQQSNELCQNEASYANPYHGEGYVNMPRRTSLPLPGKAMQDRLTMFHVVNNLWSNTISSPSFLSI
ncbi:hypothetical protein RHMOL_Rhmol02G0215100 [Rhododendron molle]|uniref:Uncharacterized protein n=1 Tax=Rhododendron molle TaxID=49168 RepID=A0ACC0PSA0_RHOML|nr:hypothetical protein RHMOL_Rhmol02G0215100 [Rhododendron molle]